MPIDLILILVEEGAALHTPLFATKVPISFFFLLTIFNLNPFYLIHKPSLFHFFDFFLHCISSVQKYLCTNINVVHWYLASTTCNKYFITCTTMFTSYNSRFIFYHVHLYVYILSCLMKSPCYLSGF